MTVEPQVLGSCCRFQLPKSLLDENQQLEATTPMANGKALTLDGGIKESFLSMPLIVVNRSASHMPLSPSSELPFAVCCRRCRAVPAALDMVAGSFIANSTNTYGMMLFGDFFIAEIHFAFR